MAKLPRFNTDPSRKKRKRPPAKAPRLDDDLIKIAQLLDEHRLDTNAKGWFTLPWRDGECAVRLALAVFYELANEANEIPASLTRIATDLHDTSFGARMTLSYEALDEYRYTMPIGHFLSASVRAAIRCRQLKMANSHGGGYVYNEVLSLALSETVTEEQVIKWRARDALGFYHNENYLDASQWERARKTFELAWKRGLYHAAYAIKPPGVKP